MIQLAWRFLEFQKGSALAKWFEGFRTPARAELATHRRWSAGVRKPPMNESAEREHPAQRALWGFGLHRALSEGGAGRGAVALIGVRRVGRG
jgi:hypothetical protein